MDINTLQKLMELKNSLIVFDSDSVDDRCFVEIINTFNPNNGNYVCIFINSYDDILNLISYHTDKIYKPLDKTLVGNMLSSDIHSINKGLDDIGIAKFNVENNILDNTLRIANVYKQDIVSEYSIKNKEELMIIIWNLVQNKMYFEEIVSLGLSKQYKDIVNKFTPFLQEEKCKRSEVRKHSAVKVVCNGKLGLLQILNNYAYPEDNNMGNAVAKSRHHYICDSIYHIMNSFEKIDKNIAKKFIMFDTLNDVFSRKYSQNSIDYIETKGDKGKNSQGAAGLIQEIYEDEKIKELKSSDPNYWLQRAKSIYITYRKKSEIDKLKEGIKWAIKAEQDSEIFVQNGEKQYKRTMSNATIQIAIMCGRVAKLEDYKVIQDNENAIEYYYKGLSDSNNMEAAKSLINYSRGTEDFKCLVNYLIREGHHLGHEYKRESDFLINIGMNGNIAYSL